MGQSEVTFTNSTGARVYIAYMRLDYDCATIENPNGDWNVLGWVKLDPGETEIRDNPTENRYFYYYAEDVNGSMWSGPYVAQVGKYDPWSGKHFESFQKCTWLGVMTTWDGPSGGGKYSPYYNVGFRELDTEVESSVNFTIENSTTYQYPPYTSPFSPLKPISPAYSPPPEAIHEALLGRAI